jgi:hypothetical protein
MISRYIYTYLRARPYAPKKLSSDPDLRGKGGKGNDDNTETLLLKLLMTK